MAAVAACSAAPTEQEKAESAERASLAAFKAKYPDVVMGYDFHGPEVDISIDLNAMSEMDEDTEAAMKAESIKRWRAAWIAAHPHQHAKLTVHILDFRGHTVYAATTAS